MLPNAIHADWYGPGAKNPALLERYGLAGKTVLMTLGRLVSAERYKGFDEVIEALPELAEAVPDVAYLVVGDGSDRERLEAEGPRARRRGPRRVRRQRSRSGKGRPLPAGRCLS